MLPDPLPVVAAARALTREEAKFPINVGLSVLLARAET